MTSHPTARRALAAFEDRFGAPAELLVRAPGRVNLIGEHTDYNDGFVLPMAIDRAVYIALRRRADTIVQVRSADFSSEHQFDATTLDRGGRGWVEYLKGTAWALTEAGVPVAGWDGVVAGDVPRGAGLSSSAALELATARALVAAADDLWDPPRMARLAQRAENEWVGVQCGIMDQMISAVGQAGHAVLIDCRTLSVRPVPLPEETGVVILDTATRRKLSDSAYNERRARCEAAAAHFKVRALRDLTPETFEQGAAKLDPITARRARHVITENARTLEAAEAMEAGHAHRLGQLMNESHRSLRDDFQVSSEALDAMVEIARDQPATFGARMTGAGFGGCAVALIDRHAADAFAGTVADLYRRRTGLEANVYVTGATAGAGLVG